MICLTESTPGPPDCIKHHPLPNLWSGFVHLSFQSWWLFHNSDLLEKGFSGKRKVDLGDLTESKSWSLEDLSYTT